MNPEVSARCPRCGDAVPLEAVTCPHCRQDLRVDLRLSRRPAGDREIYAASRALQTLLGAEGFLDIKRALEAGRSPLLSGLSPAHGERALAILAAHGGEGTLLVHHRGAAAPEPPSRRPLPIMLAAVGLVACAALGWWWQRAPNTPAPASAVARPAPHKLTSTELGSLAGASAAALHCPDSSGSGFFIAPDRLVTNAHVLCKDGEPLEIVLSDGRKLAGTVERADRTLDLALVKVDGAGAPALVLGDATPLQQGDQLFFYGSPRGLDFTLSRAMVSHANRAIQGLDYMQLDGNVNPGNSGGPLLTPSGEVVGIVTAMIGEASGLGLALPVNYLYTGDHPLTSAPPGTDPSAWREIVAGVAAAEERELRAARETLGKPALVGVVLTEQGILALIARQSEAEPFSERFDFRVQHGGNVVCNTSGQANRWGPAGRTADGTTDEHTRSWIEENHLGGTVWVTSAALDWVGCPRPEEALGFEVVMAQGGAGGSRAVISTPRGH